MSLERVSPGGLFQWRRTHAQTTQDEQEAIEAELPERSSGLEAQHGTAADARRLPAMKPWHEQWFWEAVFGLVGGMFGYISRAIRHPAAKPPEWPSE